MSEGKVYLIRHGKAVHNDLFDQLGEAGYADPRGEDGDLTELGQQQAASIAQRVAQQVKRNSGGVVECAYVSPLNRTIQTLHAFREQLDVKRVVVDFRLIERTGNGWIANQPRTPEAIAVRYPYISLEDISEPKYHPIADPWEEPQAVRDRMQHFLQDLLDKHGRTEQQPRGSILVVSHHDALFEAFGVSLPNCGMVALSFDALAAHVHGMAQSPKGKQQTQREGKFRTSSN